MDPGCLPQQYASLLPDATAVENSMLAIPKIEFFLNRFSHRPDGVRGGEKEAVEECVTSLLHSLLPYFCQDCLEIFSPREA